MQNFPLHYTVGVFIDGDVGKGHHHAVALDRNGRRLYNTALPNTEVAHKAFASAADLAADAGLAPVTRRSGSSIRGEHPSRRGIKVLKRALFLSAFAALRDPISGLTTPEKSSRVSATTKR